MTNRDEIFERINELIENSGVSYEINDMAGLEEFLENEDYQQLDDFEEIEGFYNELMDSSSYEEEE